MCGIVFVCKYGQEFTQKEKDTHQIMLENLNERGPDDKRYEYIVINSYYLFLGFTRLAIMDTTAGASQPFSSDSGYSICNGEIYNFTELCKEYNISLKTHCDCEVILPLYDKLEGKHDFFNKLDAEYAMVIVDTKREKIIASRDEAGVRPLFYGTSGDVIAFASEAKALVTMNTVIPVNPKHIYEINLSGKDINVSIINRSYEEKKDYTDHSIEYTIRKLLTEAVAKRLYSDRPIGFFLSGGLDSSLVLSIATHILGKDNIECFSIGLQNSEDVKYAKMVTQHLGIKKHHCVEFTIEEGIDSIKKVIERIESYDVTTIRASVPQYLLAKYIKNNTNIKVLLSGEGADELFGSYRYFRDAPTDEEFERESIRLLDNLYMYDNLRSDRTTAGFGLELRVPFLDKRFVSYIKQLSTHYKRNSRNVMEKLILRKAFDKEGQYLPNSVLYRSKEAFSDAVSSSDISWYKSIQKHIEENVSNEEYIYERDKITLNIPETKEAYYYRKIFDTLYKYPNLIAHYWMPKFQKENITDPSATVLNSY